MASAAKQVRALVRRSPLLTQLTESAWRVLQLALRPRKIHRHARRTDRLRVMIGSGSTRLEGWLATDLLPSGPEVVLLDAATRFPFADGSVHRIATEHMIEHVDHPVGRRMLAECYRVLEPGGRIRICTPDFDQVVALTGPVSTKVATEMREANLRCGVDDIHADDPVFTVNRLFSEYGHRFLYTERLLRFELEAAGFTDVERHVTGESDDPELADVDQRPQRADAAWIRYQTLVLEATKPGRASSERPLGAPLR